MHSNTYVLHHYLVKIQDYTLHVMDYRYLRLKLHGLNWFYCSRKNVGRPNMCIQDQIKSWYNMFLRFWFWLHYANNSKNMLMDLQGANLQGCYLYHMHCILLRQNNVLTFSMTCCFTTITLFTSCLYAKC